MRSVVLAMFLFPCFAATAANGASPKPLEISAIVEQQSQIRSDVLAGQGRYKNMSPSKRADLLAKQAGLMAIISGKSSVDELSDSQRMNAFNTLEWIQAAINNEEDERLVCHRERTIGSQRVTRVCRTAAEERRFLEEARDRMQRGDPLGTGKH